MANEKERGVKPLKSSPVTAYITHHIRVFLSSLGELTRKPVASLMTTAVIAIALALPTGLYILMNNISHISADWDGAAQLSLFLKPNVQSKQIEKLANRLRLRKDVKDLQVISREQALEEFIRISGFGDALNALDENPLPAVIVIQPVVDSARPGQVAVLVDDMHKLPEVDLAQLDLQWVKRLYTMLDIATRGIWIIGILLALAVLLTIGNTIRLDIQNRREEIEVTKLIGATDAFIRRPFLYTGLWYGIAGGLLAVILMSVAFSLLEAPVHRLAGLYNSGFELTGLNFDEIGKLLLISCTLGLAGSWLAVSRHLSQIEPS